MSAPFKPDPDLQNAPAVREGYVILGGPVKWVAYKPQGAKQIKRKGRWKAMNDYGGWENCETPAEVWLEFPDHKALATEADALRAENERLRDGIDAINQYSTDTLYGPTKRVDDTREWQRQSVSEVTRRSRLLLRGYHWDAVDEGDTPKGRAALEDTKP